MKIWDSFLGLECACICLVIGSYLYSFCVSKKKTISLPYGPKSEERTVKIHTILVEERLFVNLVVDSPGMTSTLIPDRSVELRRSRHNVKSSPNLIQSSSVVSLEDSSQESESSEAGGGENADVYIPIQVVYLVAQDPASFYSGEVSYFVYCCLLI
ncbi:unnamed protein product [Cuscuta epithymum]|uniref:Uncharacterized protein n=1 Tax=Cuscuta epithymum TaxID=186058 RepID=A0AAV0FZM8_9ASTE|nr:unnamed protein product [Cuscuta epithymum]